MLVPPCFQEWPVVMVMGKSFDFGVCLFCPGGDGSMIRIERCSFTGNQAIGTQDNYGAAVAFSLLTILREKESLPRHEVVDW